MPSGIVSVSQVIQNRVTRSEENHLEALDTSGQTAFQKVQKTSLKPSKQKNFESC